MLLTPAGLTVVGLILDMVGVLVLYRYGLPPRTPPPPKELEAQGYSVDLASRTIMQAEREQGSSFPDELSAWYQRMQRRYNLGAGIGIVLLCVGFGLQGIAVLVK